MEKTKGNQREHERGAQKRNKRSHLDGDTVCRSAGKGDDAAAASSGGSGGRSRGAGERKVHFGKNATKRERGRKSERKTTRQGKKVNALQHYYFGRTKKTKKKNEEPRRPLLHSFSLSPLPLPPLLEGLAPPARLGLSSFLLLSFSLNISRVLSYSHISTRGSNAPLSREN